MNSSAIAAVIVVSGIAFGLGLAAFLMAAYAVRKVQKQETTEGGTSK